MRVAIAGAGDVGQSIAKGLLATGHKVLLIERRRPNYLPWLVPEADWMLADACELANLNAAGIDDCDVVIATTGDDKANLVFAMLCKTELGVPRVVARINQPANQWLFTESWGVDVAVSTPVAMVSAVEEEVRSGDPVRLLTFGGGHSSIVECTVHAGSALEGATIRGLGLPEDTALLAVLRDGVAMPSESDGRLAAGDEIVFVAATGAEHALHVLFGASS